MSQFFDSAQRIEILFWTIVVYISWRWIASWIECMCSHCACVWVCFISYFSFIRLQRSHDSRSCVRFIFYRQQLNRQKKTIKLVVTIFSLCVTRTKTFMKCWHCPSNCKREKLYRGQCVSTEQWARFVVWIRKSLKWNIGPKTNTQINGGIFGESSKEIG